MIRVGIIGAGAIGRTIGRLLSDAGHDVLVSWASTEDRLRAAAMQIGAATRIGTPEDAVGHGEAIVFAPRFEHVGAASEAAGDFAGKVVIDTTNPYNATRDGLVDLGEQSSGRFVSAQLRGARYVRGFNTLTSGFFAESAGRTGADRVVVFLSGDDAGAKDIAARLVSDAGFEAVDLGALDDSARQEPGGEYYGEEFQLGDVAGLPRLPSRGTS